MRYQCLTYRELAKVNSASGANREYCSEAAKAPSGISHYCSHKPSSIYFRLVCSQTKYCYLDQHLEIMIYELMTRFDDSLNSSAVIQS